MTTPVRGPGGMASILELTKEIKMDPDNALLHAERSECFRIIQQHYHAVKDAEKCISLRPKWYKGYYLKGLALHGAENYKAALETFEDGLDYSTEEHLIKAMQNANRAVFKARFNDKFRSMAGLFFGCLVGLVALAVNDFVLPKPIVANAFLKMGILGMWCFCGMEMGSNYSKMLKEECEKRLKPPEDLFPTESKQSTESSTIENSSTDTSREGLSDYKDKLRSRNGRKQHKS